MVLPSPCPALFINCKYAVVNAHDEGLGRRCPSPSMQMIVKTREHARVGRERPTRPLADDLKGL